MQYGHCFLIMEDNGIMLQEKKPQECLLSPAGNGPFNITSSSVALVSIVTRPHSATGLQNCFPQHTHTHTSYLLSQMVGQTAFLSIARLISCISRGSLAPSGQVGHQCIPQCNRKSSVTRSPSRAGHAFSPGQLFPNLHFLQTHKNLLEGLYFHPALFSSTVSAV